MAENAHGPSYYADPNKIQNGVRLIDQLATNMAELLGKFCGDVKENRYWPGENDSTAMALGPAEEKERRGAITTGEAVSEAVGGVAKGTLVNWTKIKGNQENNLTAIRAQANGGKGH